MVKKQEKDSVYFLKLVIFLIFGAIWLTFEYQGRIIPVPVGLIVGLFLAHHEHFTVDRKIEIAILLGVATASFLFPIGFVLQI